MEKIFGKIRISKNREKKLEGTIKNLLDFKKEIEKNFKKDLTKLIEVIFGGAILLASSDVHLEPEKEKVKLRVRIDGFLHKIIFFEHQQYLKILSRLKLLAGMKINITKKPQDGRFTIYFGEREIEVRASTLPSEFGETLVMRILDPAKLIEIEQLGIREDMLEIFKKEIKKPTGMIIVTGPTGSGKTTTLYAILKRIQRPEIKIITIENPIEYHLKGISQTQVDPKRGYTFASGLKAIVRQDPDVILVGEIRDYQTAKIAIQAGLTGHLVLTTLHTNDSAGTVLRLIALGENPINIAPALNLAIAQRLARKVCKKCAKFIPPKEKDFLLLKKELAFLPKNIKIPKITRNFKIPYPNQKGCSFCNFTGYKGRVGIFEFFLATAKIKELILKSPSIVDLKKAAEKEGMVPMRKDGLIKVIKGITTIEEVERVAPK